MVAREDPDFHTVEEQFHEAVFTHASTSPNLQSHCLAGRRETQMELEGI